ncbi:MAG: tRNA glutamyl-Q(34) synthetase GluQRS [Gammaproteobacteria bacterium]|nr:tRNA glutamyl-Q(34) synthetase GluQRS [Gammaproteobacteria bacterium]
MRTIQTTLPNIIRPYIGRFAPSPTGPLHFGSLIAAVGSYLQARCNKGLWHIRIEDIDPPREVPGSASSILFTLEKYGFQWDGSVLYQSQRGDYYQAALDSLLENQQAYRCTCSRKMIQKIALQGREGLIYPGTCRHAEKKTDKQCAIRIRCHNRATVFDDAVQGRISQHLETEAGDYVIYRSDGYWAYQLAVTIDDAAQKISEVVRGSDLLYSTPRQIHLQQQLNYPTPNYLHLPIAINQQGKKLSKQTRAPALSVDNPLPTLIKVLQFLNQSPPETLQDATLHEFWLWAIQHWQPDIIPKQQSIITND